MPGDVAHVLRDGGQFVNGAQIGLLKHQHHLLQPILLDAFQKIPCYGAPWISRRKAIDDRICPGDEGAGDQLLPMLDGIHPRRVHHLEVPQKAVRQLDLLQRGADQLALRGFPIAEKMDLPCLREDAGNTELLTKKSIQEGGFAGIDLAGDNENKGVPQSLHERLDEGRATGQQSQRIRQPAQTEQDGPEAGALIKISVCDHVRKISAEVRNRAELRIKEPPVKPGRRAVRHPRQGIANQSRPARFRLFLFQRFLLGLSQQAES